MRVALTNTDNLHPSILLKPCLQPRIWTRDEVVVGACAACGSEPEISGRIFHVGLPILIEIVEMRVVLQDAGDRYYLLNVKRQGLDVYCSVPRLGAHFSLHQSGRSHFTLDQKAVQPQGQAPVILMNGEAGQFCGKDIVRSSLQELGRAQGICTAIFGLSSLSEDFQRFNKRTTDCFVIDTRLFPKNTSGVEVGVWAVPTRNKISFGWKHRDIREEMLYKATDCEPQIWIYARPT